MKPAQEVSILRSMDGVYIDTDLGVAGTVWPIGTPGYPVDNFTDAIAIAIVRNLKMLYLANPNDSIILDTDVVGYTIIGCTKNWNTAYLNPNGHSLKDSTVYNCAIMNGNIDNGVAAAYTELQNCVLDFDIAAGTVYARNCEIWDVGVPSANSEFNGYECFGDYIVAPVISGFGGGQVDLVAFRGYCEFYTFNVGTLYLDLAGATVFLDDDVTHVQISGRGKCLWTNFYTSNPYDFGTDCLWPEKDVSINAIVASETDFLNLSDGFGATVNKNFYIEDLVLKCADPGANTVNVKLYKLVNGVKTNIKTFAITAANFANYFTMMDMFGVPRLAGDVIQITVQATAGGPYAVTGEYCYKTN